MEDRREGRRLKKPEGPGFAKLLHAAICLSSCEGRCGRTRFRPRHDVAARAIQLDSFPLHRGAWTGEQREAQAARLRGWKVQFRYRPHHAPG